MAVRKVTVAMPLRPRMNYERFVPRNRLNWYHVFMNDRAGVA